MSEADWNVTIHGRTHRISDEEYRDLLVHMRIADEHPPIQYVADLSGEEIRMPRDWRDSVTFTRVQD